MICCDCERKIAVKNGLCPDCLDIDIQTKEQHEETAHEWDLELQYEKDYWDDVSNGLFDYWDDEEYSPYTYEDLYEDDDLDVKHPQYCCCTACLWGSDEEYFETQEQMRRLGDPYPTPVPQYSGIAFPQDTFNEEYW